MDEIKIKSAIGWSIYFILYAICLIFLAPGIFDDAMFCAVIILNFFVLFIDTLIRGETEEEEKTRAEAIMGIIILLQPVFVSVVYHENRSFIREYLGIWDNSVVSIVGMLILTVGGSILIISRIQIGRYGTGKIVIEKEHQLITRGIYRYIRHPIYLGGLIGWIGLSFAFRGIIIPFIVLIIYFAVFKSRMDLEERMLLEEFGEEYSEYMKKTKRLIPRVY